MSIGAIKGLLISDSVLTDVKTVMDKHGGGDKNLWSLMGDPLLASQQDKIIKKLDSIGALKWRASEKHKYTVVDYSEFKDLEDADNLVVDYNTVKAKAPNRGASTGV